MVYVVLSYGLRYEKSFVFFASLRRCIFCMPSSERLTSLPFESSLFDSRPREQVSGTGREKAISQK